MLNGVAAFRAQIHIYWYCTGWENIIDRKKKVFAIYTYSYFVSELHIYFYKVNFQTRLCQLVCSFCQEIRTATYGSYWGWDDSILTFAEPIQAPCTSYTRLKKRTYDTSARSILISTIELEIARAANERQYNTVCVLYCVLYCVLCERYACTQA